MSSALSDTRPSTADRIVARLNPLFVLPLMTFPLIWTIGIPIALFTDPSTDPIAASIASVIVAGPVAAVIINFFFLYRLELTRSELVLHRFFRWFAKRTPIEAISDVRMTRSFLGAKRPSFSSGSESIDLMWRVSYAGSQWWPPREIYAILRRLQERGVPIDTDVWGYLGHPKTATLRRPQLIGVLGILFAITWVLLGSLFSTVIGDAFVGFVAAAAALVAAIPLNAAIAAVFWLVNRHYGDIVVPEAQHEPAAPSASDV